MAEEKVRVVLAVAAVSEQELDEFLRREGLYQEDVDRFLKDVRNAAIAGLMRQKKSLRSDDHKRINELKRELKRMWAWNERWVAKHNGEHRHSVIGLVTPNGRHERCDIDVLLARRDVDAAAQRRNAARWNKNGR